MLWQFIAFHFMLTPLTFRVRLRILKYLPGMVRRGHSWLELKQITKEWSDMLNDLHTLSSRALRWPLCSATSAGLRISIGRAGDSWGLASWPIISILKSIMILMTSRRTGKEWMINLILCFLVLYLLLFFSWGLSTIEL